jgi:hypothetical protein
MWTDTTRKQFARRGMGGSRAAVPGAFAPMKPAPVELPADRRGAALSLAWRVAVADAATRSVPDDDIGTALLLSLARHRAVALDQSHADDGGA